jgi:hypothetical protein
MLDSILAREKGYAKLIEAAGGEAQAIRKYTPIVVPAQIQSETAQLVYNNYKSSLQRYSKPHAALSLRQLLPLLPMCSARGSVDFMQVSRQAKCSVDNTLFVYPTFLDRFKNRYVHNKTPHLAYFSHLSVTCLIRFPAEICRSRCS